MWYPSMMNKLLARVNHRDIYQYDNDVCIYLRRYYLFPTKPRGECRFNWPFGIKIHNIKRSDLDRDLHDHPWGFWSLILKGGYVEETPSGEPNTLTQWFGRGSFIRHKATDFHKLTLFEPTWTLVITWGRERIWGFDTAEGWVAWYDYVEDKKV